MIQDALIAQAKQGDNRAFARLYDQYRRTVYGIAWSITGRAEDAQDVVQDTFLSAFSKIADLKDARKFPGWVSIIARNLSFDVIARRKRHRVDEQWLRERDLNQPIGNAVDEATRLNLLWASLEHLGQEERTVVVLHHLTGQDIRTIAESLTIPEGTVKSRLFRARKILKERMLIMAKEDTGTFGPADDYGRSKLGGMTVAIAWETLLSGDGLDGWTETDVPLANSTPAERGQSWQRNKDVITGHVDSEKTSRLVMGDDTWKSYELSLNMTLLEGSDMQVHFRVSPDGAAYYLLDFLYGWQAVAISRMSAGAGEVEKLSVVNFPFERNREYNVLIAARELSITSYIDGKLIHQLTEENYRSGGIGLGLWWSKVAYRDPCIRHYN